MSNLPIGTLLSFTNSIVPSMLGYLSLVLMSVFTKRLSTRHSRTVLESCSAESVGGYGLGVILWFIVGYVLIQAPWAPLRILIGDAVIRGRTLALLLVLSCLLGYSIMYRLGKRRNWKTIFTKENEIH